MSTFNQEKTLVGALIVQSSRTFVWSSSLYTHRDINTGWVVRHKGVLGLASLGGDIAEDLQGAVEPFYAEIKYYIARTVKTEHRISRKISKNK